MTDNFFIFCPFFLRTRTFILILITLVPLAPSEDVSEYQEEDAFIDSINSEQDSWRAARNLFFDSVIRSKKSTPSSTSRSKAETEADDEASKLPVVNVTEPNLPEEFDSRKKWPFCPSIGEISDQASCGSCWAVSAVDSMSDRVCIHSNGKLNFRFSAANVISCCKKCGKGCRGGTHRLAWKYWVDIGIVSGGPFGSESTCQPYQFPPCEHHMIGPRRNCSKYSYTPPCRLVCQSKYNTSYKEDLHFGKSVYSVAKSEEAIKTEIYRNGPVQGSMELFMDHYAYKSGVYQHVKGSYVDMHAIRIIGWGVENGTGIPYWLVANSFNYDWGDHGFIKVKRGSNECLIESDITAGLPRDFVES